MPLTDTPGRQGSRQSERSTDKEDTRRRCSSSPDLRPTKSQRRSQKSEPGPHTSPKKPAVEEATNGLSLHRHGKHTPEDSQLTTTEIKPPTDAATRRAVKPVICYPVETLPRPDTTAYRDAREGWTLVQQVKVLPREASCFKVPAGHFFRICSVDGPQVGDLNLFCAKNLNEHFYSGKTRGLFGTHIGIGVQLYSSFPWLRPMATVTDDTLDWYGIDEYGGAVHDIIGTRCDPYTHHLLSGGHNYHRCCHSNLTRALATHSGLPLLEAEGYIHDVVNVFMCTGYTRDKNEYFMKASPVRPGDYIEFFAEMDLLACLSACPGGDCSTVHSSDAATCYPLNVEVYRPAKPPTGWGPSKPNGYDRSHGAS